MTAQDWLPGLEDDEAQAETAAPRRRRWLLAGAAALASLAALTAVAVVAHGLSAAPPARPTAPTAPSRAAAHTAATATQGRIIIRAGLTDIPSEGGMSFAPLVVGTQPLQGGAAPDRVPNFDQAFTPSTPQGRPDVFRSLQLRVSNIRYGDRLPIVGAPTVGSLCPGTQRDLCAPLK